MPKKTILPKQELKSAGASAKKGSSEKYFQGIGRRKLSVAVVKIFASSGKEKVVQRNPEILVNGKPHTDYFCLSDLRDIIAAPLKAVSPTGISKISIAVRGGGIRGQAESSRLGIARALVLKDQEIKKTLKDLGYLTRDARVVERKKPGLKKARRAPQFSKR